MTPRFPSHSRLVEWAHSSPAPMVSDAVVVAFSLGCICGAVVVASLVSVVLP